MSVSLPRSVGSFAATRRFRPSLLVLGVLFVAGLPLHAETLFPAPIHLTRTVVDPISGKTSTIEEYFVGDRMISTRGALTSIADYKEGTLTAIDRERGTYSVTPFAKLASAGRSVVAAKRTESSDVSSRWEFRPVSAKALEGNSGGARIEAVRKGAGSGASKIRLALDGSVTLSRAALEVLIGAAFPFDPSEESEVILTATRRESLQPAGMGGAPGYALPTETTITYVEAGETLELTSRVIRIGSEVPPPDTVAIPPGATRVELPRSRLQQELDEADSLPSANGRQP